MKQIPTLSREQEGGGGTYLGQRANSRAWALIQGNIVHLQIIK